MVVVVVVVCWGGCGDEVDRLNTGNNNGDDADRNTDARKKKNINNNNNNNDGDGDSDGNDVGEVSRCNIRIGFYCCILSIYSDS